MSNPTKYKDADIRLIMLEHLYSEHSCSDHIVAFEAKYGYSARRSYIILITEFTHAFEIKSDVDNLDRLEEQLHDYRRTFDKVTVVTTEAQAPRVRKFLGRNDGLIIIKQGKVIKKRSAKLNRKLLKRNLVAICSKKVLSDKLNFSISKHSIQTLAVLVEKKVSTQDLKEMARDELVRRFNNRYARFCKEACPPFRETDLKVLQHGNKLNLANASGDA